MTPLHQIDPRPFSTYTQHKSYSYTDSLDSYQNGAEIETRVYWREGRIPTKELVIHLFRKYTVNEKKDIEKLRTKIFQDLYDHGIEGVANIEVTEGSDAEGTIVHFHVLTDDSRSERELRKLFNDACEHQGLIRESDCPVWDDDLLIGYSDADFRVDYRTLWDGYEYFKYFTKWGEKWRYEVILFQKGLRMQKFYEIGQWFSRKKTEIRNEILAERRAWAIAKQEEEDRLRVEFERQKWERADHTKLQEVLDMETDETLCDWFCYALGKCTPFQTLLPRWLTKTLPNQPLKMQDMILAIGERIKHSNNPYVVSTFEDHEILTWNFVFDDADEQESLDDIYCDEDMVVPFEMSQEAIDELYAENEKYRAEQDGISDKHSDATPTHVRQSIKTKTMIKFEHHLKDNVNHCRYVQRVIDWRYEWRRFSYSIAFLN